MNLKGLFFIWISLEFHNKFSTGKNILIVMPVCWSSHVQPFVPLVEELIRNGHNLTVISLYPMSTIKAANYNHVEVKTNYCHSESTANAIQSLTRVNRYSSLLIMFKFHHEYAVEVLNLPEFQRIIHSRDHYDLVMIELFYMDLFFAFGNKFKAPVIALCPSHMIYFYSWILGNPYPLSYIPNQFLRYTENMSLLSRVSNSVFNIFSVVYHNWVVLPEVQSQMEKLFNFDKNDVPDIKDIMRNISLVLANTHHSLGYVKPELPNIVSIGGLHYPSFKPLSEKMKIFLDEAYHGAIYLSMGSLLQPRKFVKLGNAFIRELKDFPQRVVMKWDPKLLTEIPENFLVEEWIPQTEVLNHPNCRLFITHGGIHSIYESMNASVPIFGIPIVADQYYNMALVEHLGIGRMVALNNLMSGCS